MKFIRVNMTTKQITTQDVPKEYIGLGGRGLTSIMINADVPATCDPLGPENKLIFAPGLLSGTIVPNTSRLSIGAKSPLTGGIKESNVGGVVADALGKLGITAIIVEGQAPEGDLSLLKVDENGDAELLPAQDYKGMRTYATVEKMQAAFGKDNSVTCIGPAGEYRLGVASVQTSDVDDRPCRAAGRGGMGAVMGAKGLKAIVVARGGKSPDALADPAAFREAIKGFVKAVKENPFSGQMLPALGTAAVVAIANSMGGFPSYNATKGVLEGFENISGEKMAEVIKQRGGQTTHMGCAGCMIHCSNVFVDKDGKYVTSSLEYETLWSFGGMLGITDLDTCARCDFLCDDIGLDTMGAGVALGVAMDAGYKSFGDNQAALDMLEEIGRGSEIGLVLGNGCVAVGKHFNHERVPAVKGQSIAAYDPRALQGNGITYATSPMGADHTAGNLIGEYLGGALNPLGKEGQVEASRNAQIAMAMVDNAGICLLASFALADPAGGEAFLKIINAKLGTQMGPDDGPAQAVGILQAELEFNRKAGLTKEDDRLPKMFYDEPLPPHNKVFLFSGEELDETLKF
ncbi:MAG: aldehyde ferredoxin oxidoreductase [Deltaproteobacteria bacterium]|nr:aldehyde ferredoxin oxidoreductase [Deltaproteobacteria bacterium]